MHEGGAPWGASGSCSIRFLFQRAPLRPWPDSSFSLKAVIRACWELLAGAVITALLPPRGWVSCIHRRVLGLGVLGVTSCLEETDGVQLGPGCEQNSRLSELEGANFPSYICGKLSPD